MDYPRRKRNRWTEGGRIFERQGMVVREVVRCHCGKYHLAELGECNTKILPFRERHGKGETR